LTPSNVILDRLAELLANDTTTLAPAALAVHVHLANNAFTPGPTLTVADFVEATFDGYAPLDAEVGPQQDFFDPATGNRVVQLVEPLAGWHWVTTGVTDLPQDITGYYVTDNTDAVLYGCFRFGANVPLTASGQSVDIGNVRFSFLDPVLG
jgi:hypothetical protein